jgi:signal transduction histidine kinase
VKDHVEELRPTHSQQQKDDSPALGSETTLTVLVVEDDVDMNRFVTECLSGRYRVMSAFDGREGLEKALSCQPALVVSEITMPHVSGVEMIAEMRKRPELRLTPILLLSSKADEELKIKLLEDGAQDFVVKPFSEKDLLVRVRNLILTRQAREEATQSLQREQEARAAAERANRAKDEFLAMLGHELRNPLAPILTALELMRLRGGDTAIRERTVIERQVTHLRRLVDDLLDVSRITTGKIQLKRERIEMAEVVAKAIELISPMLEQRRQKLSTAVPVTGLVVRGDPTRLTQIVSNLLTNASKYSDVGGDVDVTVGLEREQIVLRVLDNGCGIDPDLLPHVFDLFTQDQRRADRSQGGLGLGLAIVRSLVLLHDGSVEAHSQGLNRGSQFTVRLPADAPQAMCDSATALLTGSRPPD